MCERGFVCFSLVTPHLKDDDFTKRSKYKFETSRLDLAFLLAPKMVVFVFQPSFFKSWQSKWDVKPMFLVANSMKNDFIYLFSSHKARKVLSMGGNRQFHSMRAPLPPPPSLSLHATQHKKKKGSEACY